MSEDRINWLKVWRSMISLLGLAFLLYAIVIAASAHDKDVNATEAHYRIRSDEDTRKVYDDRMASDNLFTVAQFMALVGIGFILYGRLK